MPPEFKRFLLNISVLSALIIGISFWASVKGILKLPSAFFITPALFFYFLSAFMCFFLMKASRKSGSEFIRTFMATQALKMFIHLIIMTVISFGFPSYAIQFITVYALSYLVYTVVELITLMPLAKRKH